ncbi:hypothetical protein IT084_00265 [Desulfallas sp. Bu1-1]|jgi:hypothetical protein|uniref:hypothetical protein n=1 Tax=Desulfallas sp. Bu1-1 TaxID=2787620 RepID=UPI0018A08C6F|nr:hypothetical protein [Desulfallas sp. Bu1-1]MBF7081415.1 hypothetical protein [Desulfallas sp. Bu1-1]
MTKNNAGQEQFYFNFIPLIMSFGLHRANATAGGSAGLDAVATKTVPDQAVVAGNPAKQ